MNSKERHEARYQRRKQKRDERKRLRYGRCDDFDEVFAFDNLYTASRKCCLGVGWKASTQRYKANALRNVADTLSLLHNNKFKSRGFYEFDRCERGKLRHIKSVPLNERVVQRCLCDNSLVDMYSRSFIYDNGACIKNKGVSFAVARLKCHLQRHYRKYGTEGYALVFDFSKYFDNIQHEPLKEIVDKVYTDNRIKTLIKQLYNDFGEIGLGLGSQVSQSSALMYPNRVDHFIKEVLKIKNYARYMDDGYLLHPSKDYLKYCLERIREICAELGIKLNPKKTQIVKISRGITFLKRRFKLTDTGAVIIKPSRKGVTKMRRKMRTYQKWVESGKMTIGDVRTSCVSFIGGILKCNAYHTIVNILKLYYQLFKEALYGLKGRFATNYQ